MDPFHLSIALGPVAVYLLLLGIINLASHPFLTSGTRDAAALATAISGLAIAGPLKLFAPEAAIFQFGSFVWLMMLMLYALGATLVILSLRPRLVVYNATVDQLRPVLAAAVQRLEEGARWAGDSLHLPKLGVQLHLEESPWMRNVQLVSSGPRQSFAGWRMLEVQMKRSLKDVSTSRNRRGVTLVLVASSLFVAIAISLVRDQQSVAQALLDFLRFQ